MHSCVNVLVLLGIRKQSGPKWKQLITDSFHSARWISQLQLSGVGRFKCLVPGNRSHPLGTINIWTKFHGNPYVVETDVIVHRTTLLAWLKIKTSEHQTSIFSEIGLQTFQRAKGNLGSSASFTLLYTVSVSTFSAINAWPGLVMSPTWVSSTQSDWLSDCICLSAGGVTTEVMWLPWFCALFLCNTGCD